VLNGIGAQLARSVDPCDPLRTCSLSPGTFPATSDMALEVGVGCAGRGRWGLVL